MSRGTLFLSGGGTANQSIVIDRSFVNALPSLNILYIPIALDDDGFGYKSCMDWLEATLEELTDDPITITVWNGKDALPDLSQFSGVYIGGGNTYKLLHILTRTSAKETLVEYFNKGGIIYGGSAGAIILGKTIETVAPEKEDKKHTEVEGLDLLYGRSVICHYVKSQDQDISQMVSKYKTEIIAIPEDSGLKVSGGKVEVIGRSVKFFQISDKGVFFKYEFPSKGKNRLFN